MLMSLDNTEPDITPELSLRRRNAEYITRGQIVAICNAAIGEYVDVLAAAHELNRLGFELFAQSDEDFKVFAAVSSETEDLPIGAERRNWHPDALAEKDEEVKRMAAVYFEVVRDGCERLRTRLALHAPSIFDA